MIQIDGKHVDTISTYADSIETSVTNVSNWVKKYVEKGGVLEVAHQIGNMKFYEVATLDVIKNTFARAAKPKKRKISEVDYDHVCALLDATDNIASVLISESAELSAEIERLQVELRNAKAYSDSIISG